MDHCRKAKGDLLFECDVAPLRFAWCEWQAATCPNVPATSPNSTQQIQPSRLGEALRPANVDATSTKVCTKSRAESGMGSYDVIGQWANQMLHVKVKVVAPPGRVIASDFRLEFRCHGGTARKPSEPSNALLWTYVDKKTLRHL